MGGRDPSIGGWDSDLGAVLGKVDVIARLFVTPLQMVALVPSLNQLPKLVLPVL